jgi:hypothetical protein
LEHPYGVSLFMLLQLGQQQLLVPKMMELSKQQMLVGIIQTYISKTKATLLVYFVKVDIQVAGLYL